MCVRRRVGDGELEAEEEVDKGDNSGEISYSYWWAAKYFGVEDDDGDVNVNVDPLAVALVSMERCFTVIMTKWLGSKICSN